MLKLIKPYGDCSSVGRAIGCGPIGRRFESDQSPEKFSGCSVVRLAHLLWEQGVAGSNPATSTKTLGNPYLEGLSKRSLFTEAFLFRKL